MQGIRPIDPPGPGEGGHEGGEDVREPPLPAPGKDDLPGRDDDVDPEDGGGTIKKKLD
jgi:hypothetical protein